ncbi:MAG: ADP-heptose--LPS heptosyltransferase [Blastocatellia bacterium]
MTDHLADLWMEQMRRGDFEAAWQISDAVLQSRLATPRAELPRHLQRIWDGTPLNSKRVLVRCYHGLGDTIQFIRYAPLLKAVATEVLVLAQPRLIPLLTTARGIDRLLPLDDGEPQVEFDADVETMELPHVFRTTLETIPTEIPYLHVEPISFERDDHLEVGVVWTAGDWDARRCIPFSVIAPLFDVRGVRWHILQRDAEACGWRKGMGTRTGGSDILEDARIIRALDLLISVDTMTAHLAGALGVPVWTLLQAEADWRWMQHRIDSLWYPTMRLFRQASPGKWAEVISQVAAVLERMIATG